MFKDENLYQSVQDNTFFLDTVLTRDINNHHYLTRKAECGESRTLGLEGGKGS